MPMASWPTSSSSTTGIGMARNASTSARSPSSPAPRASADGTAQFLAALNRPQDAESEATEAANVNPLSAEAALNRALILYYACRYDEALSAAEHARQLDPNLPTSSFLIGRIQEALGKLTDAIDATDRAIRTSSTVAAGSRIQAIRLQALSGQTPNARAAFAKLLSDPGGEAPGRQSTSSLTSISPWISRMKPCTRSTGQSTCAIRRAVDGGRPEARIHCAPWPEFQSLLRAVGLR